MVEGLEQCDNFVCAHSRRKHICLDSGSVVLVYDRTSTLSQSVSFKAILKFS